MTSTSEQFSRLRFYLSGWAKCVRSVCLDFAHTMYSIRRRNIYSISKYIIRIVDLIFHKETNDVASPLVKCKYISSLQRLMASNFRQVPKSMDKL